MSKKLDRPFTSAVILAAGSGSRMGMEKTKQIMTICGKTVLLRAVEVFERAACIDSIAVVCREEELEFVKRELSVIAKLESIVIGGKTRAESSRRGFMALSNKSGYVLIHDAARCLVTESDIEAVASAAYEYGCATASNSVVDTVKTVDGNIISGTLDRDSLRTVQTPQAFSCDIYSRAIENAEKFNKTVTDDNMLAEALGEKIYAVSTSDENIKITKPTDLGYAEYIIKRREENK